MPAKPVITRFSDLIDATTADLPNINLPLRAALDAAGGPGTLPDLATTIKATVDGALALGGTESAQWSTYDPTNLGGPNYVHNTNGYFYSLREYFTGVSPWNSHNTSGDFPGRIGAGVLVAPRIFATAAHNAPPLNGGEVIHFVDADGNAEVCNILKRIYHPNYRAPDGTRANDVALSIIDRDLDPTRFRPMKLMPTNWPDYLPFFMSNQIPVIRTNQFKDVYASIFRGMFVDDLRHVDEHRQLIGSFIPTNANYLATHVEDAVGNSSSPAYFPVNSDPVLLYCIAGNESGHALGDDKAILDQMIVDLDDDPLVPAYTPDPNLWPVENGHYVTQAAVFTDVFEPITKEAPGPSDIVTLDPIDGGASVVLQNAEGAVRNRIYEEGNATPIHDEEQVIFDLTGLTPGQTYRLQSEGVNDQGPGTRSAFYEVTPSGSNTPAIIGGTQTASVNEDDAATLTASGTLTVTDSDAGEAVFVAQTDTDTGIGTFNLDTAGNWTWSADNSQSAIQDLDTGESLDDVINVATADGTTGTVTITINGVDEPAGNTPAIIGGDQTASVNEDDAATLTASGTLTVTDPDAGEAVFVAQVDTDTGIGTFNLDTAGNWTWSADNSQSQIQDLDTGETLVDAINVTTADGTVGAVTITINGLDEAAPVLGTYFRGSGANNSFARLDTSQTLEMLDDFTMTARIRRRQDTNTWLTPPDEHHTIISAWSAFPIFRVRAETGVLQVVEGASSGRFTEFTVPLPDTDNFIDVRVSRTGDQCSIYWKETTDASFTLLETVTFDRTATTTAQLFIGARDATAANTFGDIMRVEYTSGATNLDIDMTIPNAGDLTFTTTLGGGVTVSPPGVIRED